MTEQEAIELLQNLNVKLTDMSGHKTNGIEKIFGWNEITAICEAIKALEEIQQYRAIGTVSELQDIVIGINALADRQFSAADMAKLVNDMKSLYEYRQIGTPEECRAAMEKQKELIAYCDENDCYECPFHSTNQKYNKCMNDFIADEIVKGGGVNA